MRFTLPLEPDRCRRGEQIGHFTLGEPLAYGGMGVVYVARQDIGRDVALKLIHPAFFVTEQQDAVARFQQEIAILAQLEHPHVARIYDGGMHRELSTGDVTPFLAMQLVRGGTPLTTYAAECRLSVRERVELFLTVCEAIHYAHTRGVVHRDLKPANILVDAGGHLFVIDFGLAQLCHAARLGNVHTAFSGTPAYMSPEQVSEVFGPVGPTSDVYALGAILYELLAGQRPYDVSLYTSAAMIRQAIVQAVPTPLGQRKAACSGVLETIVATALAKQPGERYPSVAALHTALRRYLETTAPVPPRGTAAVGPFYLADHRLVVWLEPGPTGNTVVMVETRASELADATLRFTIGDEAGAVRLHPSSTHEDMWYATRALTQSFATASRCGPDFAVELPQPELRQVTALLVTWTGTSHPVETQSAGREPTELLRCHAIVTDTVQRYDGHVVPGVMDEEVLVFFGIPHMHENDAERAIMTALALRHGLAMLGSQVAVGITTRQVYISPRREDTHAADLSHHVRQVHERASIGEVLVGATTYATTRRAFVFQPRQEPAPSVPVYAVLALEPPSDPTELVGREEECAALRTCVERVRAGTGQLVVVLGEAGIGKSRLVAETHRHVTDEMCWLESHASSSSRALSYGPFRDILGSAVGITPADDDIRAASRLVTHLRALLPEEWEEHLPCLLRVLGVRGSRADEDRMQYLAPDALNRKIFRAVFRFFARLAGERPVVLVLEDWHWRDHASMALLDHLVSLIHQVPLLICVVSRSESPLPVTSWQETAVDKYQEITLKPLSSTASAHLLDSLVSPDALTSHDRASLLGRSGGNPFFLEELVLTFLQHGALAWEGQHARPEALEAHIFARFSQLPETLKQVLRIAAVIGRSFGSAMIRVIAPMRQEEVAQHLGVLQRLHLLAPQRPGEEYQFRHELIQEVIYHNLLVEQQQALHRKVGACIEQLYADRLDAFTSQLAYHYTRAEAWEKAKDYLLKAGDQAHQVAADVEALALYQQVVDVFEGKLEAQQWISLQRKMGESLFRRGEYDKAEGVLERGLRKLGSPLPDSRWRESWVILKHLSEQVGHRLLPGRLLPTTTEADILAVQEQVRIHETMSLISYLTGRGSLLLLNVLAMLNLAERSLLTVDMARGAAAVGAICDLSSLFRLGEHYHHRAVALAEQSRDPVARGFAYFCQAHHEECVNKWDEALQHHELSAAAYQDGGHMRGWSVPMSSVIRLHIQRGHFARSLQESEKLTQVGKDGADLLVRGWGLLCVGWSLLRMGELEEAKRSLQESTALLLEVPDYPALVEANGLLGQSHLRLGEAPQAVAVLEESHRLVAERGLKGSYLLPFRYGLAEVYLSLAEQSSDVDRPAQLKRAQQACRAAQTEGRFYSGGLSPAYRVRGTYEWLRGRPTIAQNWWHKSLRSARAVGARWELGMTHLEMGKRLQDRLHVETAVTLFSDMGAAMEAEKGRQLLQRRH